MIASVSDDSFTTRKAIQISINNLNDNTPGSPQAHPSPAMKTRQL